VGLKNMSSTIDTDCLLDLKKLSKYSSLGVPTLREHIRSGSLPCFKVKGKILIKKSEFDSWIESFRVDTKKELDSLVNGVMESLKS
jgi:excisionase family DNA binding protein